jgi:hypothetical protein
MRGKMLAALQFIILACGYGAGPSLVAFFSDKVFSGPGRLGPAFLVVALPLCVLGFSVCLLSRKGYFAALGTANVDPLTVPAGVTDD